MATGPAIGAVDGGTSDHGGVDRDAGAVPPSVDIPTVVADGSAIRPDRCGKTPLPIEPGPVYSATQGSLESRLIGVARDLPGNSRARGAPICRTETATLIRDAKAHMDHSSQLLKGVLDMCLLALIAEEPSYGYEMVDKLERRGLELVSGGSIYPLLSRLQKRGYIEGYFVESSGGPPRKYYRIAADGRVRLAEWMAEWSKLSRGVEEVLNGGIRG